MLELPFKGKSLRNLIDNITNEEMKPITRQYSNPIKLLTGKMLHKDPTTRPTPSDILKKIREWSSESKKGMVEVEYQCESTGKLAEFQSWDECIKEAERNILPAIPSIKCHQDIDTSGGHLKT